MLGRPTTTPISAPGLPGDVAEPIAKGDRVALADAEGGRSLVVAGDEPFRLAGIGVIDPGKLVGLPWGGTYRLGSRTWRALRPGFADFSAGITRKAQIVLPKDAARILFECDIHAGTRVLESGAGSGALTTALAHAVQPGGRVLVVEVRPDFLHHARSNLERAGLAGAVEFRLGDVARGVAERDLDAFILDIPNPWDAVPAAKAALRPDGHFAAYNPLVSQMEQTVAALQGHGFEGVRVLEILEREWHVGERGSRPDHAMLGHTGFLVLARGGSS